MRRGAEIRLSALYLAALALIAPPACAGSGTASQALVVGTFRLDEPGGLSGLEFSADGKQFVALSDSAAIVRGSVIRDDTGAITSLTFDAAPQPLGGSDGQPLSDPYDDAEGLAEGPDGTLYVSFELHNRVERYDRPDAAPTPLPVPREFIGFSANAGLEALAIAPDGALFTLPEGPASGAAQIPVFRFRDGEWGRPFFLRGDGTWRPVGADFGADGRLYLLERDFWALVGFMSRVRRISFDEQRITGEEVLLITTAGQFGNLEGLSVWQDGEGRIHATMVSDNNFLPFLPTEFVDVVFDSGLDPKAGGD